MHTWADMPPDPLRVLNACARRASRVGAPPPAAFLGDWLDSAAVIAPSVRLEPVAADQVFADDLVVVDTPHDHPSSAHSFTAHSSADHHSASHSSADRHSSAERPFTLGFRSFPDAPTDAGGPSGAGGSDRLLPEAVSGRADGLLILDHDGRWRTRGSVPTPRDLELTTDPAPTCSGADEGTVADSVAGRRDDRDDDEVVLPRWSAPDRDAHRAAVLDCLEAIRAGEIYQACLSTRLDGHLHGEPLALFSELWQRTRARRAAFMQGPWGAVVSLSPEVYLTRRGREVYSSPIKGTLPRSADPDLLRASAKDVAENIMIVDLVRHDLGRTADLGSVTVPELLTIHEAPGVWHLVSTVAARTDVSHRELVGSTFPPASVTGTPKLRARELIAGWEPRARGLHCGAIGIAGAGQLDLSVAIRTLEIGPDGRCELGVGGGITIDSDPDAEWDECLHKAAFTWGGGPAPW